MVSIMRASSTDYMYPYKNDVLAMVKRLVEYYPMLQDDSVNCKHSSDSVFKQLMKRIHNIRTPKRKRSNTTKKKEKRRDEENSDTDSQQSQARHYHTMQEIYKRPKPNKEAVVQLLDLEFDSRRAFINSDTLKDQDRPSKILQAYPCFRELDHVMDELGQILDKGNPRIIPKLKARWENFCSKAQFYGVYKKVLKLPMTLDGVKHSIAMMKALPEMFPSPVARPKKMGQASEAMLHILERKNV
ncbi:hypothetical protein KOW79_003222 [Hemibagrus wyckioides]|uniref:Uncharacterized protein n=1 Tax=Hemibagrus wyckioides TaxID=337641 RepID=A0A9D3P2A5_9TELE|nr:hypothetical protein KOW79_003222 [Hemibagrus wyckioides]